MFDATHSDGADAIHRYYGHRNNNTGLRPTVADVRSSVRLPHERFRLVKGVNFYGRNSEYIISGSDCGHVFIWDKPSEKCTWFSKGDDDGTVNVLEPHPHFPIIATSGLEHDVKIWQPTSHEAVDYKRLKMVNPKDVCQSSDLLLFA